MNTVESGPGILREGLNRFHNILLRDPLVCTTITYMLYIFAGQKMFGHNAYFPIGENVLTYASIGAGVLLGGRLADALSTINVFKAAKRSRCLGMPQNIRETNPFLPDDPSENDLFTKKSLILQSLFMAAGTAIPAVGIAGGMASFVAAIKNELVRRDVERNRTLFLSDKAAGV